MDRFFQFGTGRAGDEFAPDDQRGGSLCAHGVVVAEILQGLTRDASRIEHYLSQWELIEPAASGPTGKAAAIFRLGRAKGVSLTTIDALIAAIALEHRASVFTLDKDFFRIARLTASRCIGCQEHEPMKGGIPLSYCGS